jgi:hypothetical protein
MSLERYRTPGPIVMRNAVVLTVTMLTTLIVLRVWLQVSPDSDFDVAGSNIHHLFSGLALIVLGGVPLAVFRGYTRRLQVALVVFGVGLAMALDEWVYLIATDGSNASYLLPVSFWGAVFAVGAAVAYTVALTVYRAGRRGSS